MSTTRTALARLYRPRRFGEVAMQEHVSATLKTAVVRGRVAHAYLFAGPRGVGKTTAARVLAMALNCPNRADDGEPCGECESCERIWAGQTSLDVVEIDAASNRGVDDARDLRERAMYAPTDERRFKVYIIDEAHMLTRDAWNALLKILEEPPPRVVFVFATTEPQKIQQAAPPVLSRCQRFDFRRISVAGIVDRMRQILAAEGIEAGDDVLVPLARRAEGGMRDALSLLDQVLSFAEGAPTADDVRRILGVIDDELYLDLFRIVADRDHGGVFKFVQRLLDDGYDLTEFCRGLADALRSLLVIRLDGSRGIEPGAVREDLVPAYEEQAGHFHRGDLLRMLAQAAEFDADGRFRKSADPRLLLEALLLRFSHLDRTVELEELIRAAAAGHGAAATAGSPGAAPRVRDPGSAPPAASAVRDPRPPYAAREHGAVSGPDREVPARVLSDGGPPGAAAPVPTRREGEPGDPVSRSGSAQPDRSDDAQRLEQAFREVLEPGGGLPPGLGPFLKAAAAVPLDASTVRLELPPGPAVERLSDDPGALRSLEAALGSRLGRDIVIQIALASGGNEERITPEGLRQRQLARLANEEPDLRRAVEEFDLELRD